MAQQDDNHAYRDQLHSYALARIMMHVIGFDNFEPEDHAVHGMLIDDTRTFCQSGNFRDLLDGNIEAHKRLMKAAKK